MKPDTPIEALLPAIGRFDINQTSRVTGISKQAIRAQVARTGAVRGVKAERDHRNRLYFDRGAILALAGFHVEQRGLLDLRATDAFFASRDLPVTDPVATAFIMALCDSRDRRDTLQADHLRDDGCALRDWNENYLSRIVAAWPRMTSEQRTDAERCLALSIARVAGFIPNETLAQAVADVQGLRA